jgi:phosphatidylglycerol:prolipoprotein diacylglycerol transferase
MDQWQYALCMVAAVVTGLLLARRTPAPSGLDGTQRLGLALGAFAGGMLAAKLPFLLGDWPALASGVAWLDNGKTLLLGLVGGYLGVEIAKWALGIKTKTGDSFAVPVAAAVGVGRFGCWLAGCCYGLPTGLPWGVDFGDGLRRHPTQLYEAAFHLSAAVVLAWLQRRHLFRGQLIKLYFLAYFVFRFVTEFIRPEPRVALGLTMYQWLAVGSVLLFVGLWRWDARRYGAQWAQERADAYA